MLGCETAYVYLTTGTSSSATRFWKTFYRDSEAETKAVSRRIDSAGGGVSYVCRLRRSEGRGAGIYQALIRFENYQPAFLQVRVKELCAEAEAWAKAAEPPGATPSASNIPKIQLQRFSFFS